MEVQRGMSAGGNVGRNAVRSLWDENENLNGRWWRGKIPTSRGSGYFGYMEQ